MLISTESDISDEGRIYPMKIEYIRLDLVATVLELGRGSDISNSSDMFALGRIYLIWN
jgi:hypothetical protein